MRWAEAKRAGLLALGLLAILALGVPASADPPKPPAKFEVTVLRASMDPGGVDPRAARLNQLLAKRGINFNTIRVVDHQRETLEVGQIGAVGTPNGREYRFRPIDRSGEGFLVSVDWGTSRGDFRMSRGVPLILGGQPHEGGQLVVVLEVAE